MDWHKAPQALDQHNTSQSTEICLYIETLSTEILNVINHGNFNIPCLDHVGPDYKVRHGKIKLADSKKEWLEFVQLNLDANPDFHWNFLNTTSRVNEKNRTATVWVHDVGNSIQPHPKMVVESLKIMKWEKKGGKWMALGHHAMVAGGT
jgi:hypothetical protein